MDPFDRLTNLTTIAEEAELISLTGTPSVRSGTTVGLGTLSSRAIMAVGEYAVKGIENVNIRRKLGIASFQLRQQGAVPKQVIDDLLELQRMGLYSAPLRERACDLLMATLIKQGLEETIQLLKQWSAIEIQYFLRQFAAFKLTRWHTSGDNTLVTDQLAVTSVCARLIQAVLDKDPTMIHDAFDLEEICLLLTTQPTWQYEGEYQDPLESFMDSEFVSNNDSDQPRLSLVAITLAQFVRTGPPDQLQYMVGCISERIHSYRLSLSFTETDTLGSATSVRTLTKTGYSRSSHTLTFPVLLLFANALMNGIDEGLSEPLNSILVEEIAKIFDDYPSRLQQQSLYFVCCDALRFIQVANHTTIVACLRSRVPTSFPKLAACSARYCQISPNPWRRELRNQSYLELCDILAGRCISDGHEADPNTKLQLQVLFSEFFSQSTSLYQQCSVLRARLMRIQNFPQYFTLSSKDNASSSRRSTDPVTQLWDCFALGVPLCYLFNLLPPPIQPVPIDTASFDPTNDMIINRALVMFEAGVRQIEGCPKFTMTDLWDRNSTDGFVRVVNIVSTVVTNIPEDIFTESPHTYPPTELFTWLLHSARSTDRQPGANIAKELLYTERKYVQDLETMQWTLGQGAFLLGMNLDSLIDFHRRFLIKLESISDSPWMDGGWGNAFTEFEEEFSVYESYCVNYTNASDNLSLSEENSLVALDGLLNIKSELSAFLIMPAQRVGKYPLLLESLIKAVMNTNYSHLDELKQGLAAAKRIADKVNEEKRRAENRAAVKRLEGRVDDWRGHHVSNFGTVLLDDVFTITKSDIDREYHVFLFEKIILCFRELFLSTNGKKAGKSNGLLKTPGSPWPINISSPNLSKRGTPLLLKGRIYLQNVTSVIPKIHAGRYSLAVYWKGDHDIEYFTLRCRNEEQLRLWENSLVRLLADIAARRTTDSL